MKFIVATFLTALLCFAVGLFTILPWYSFVFCAFIASFVVQQKPLASFGAGFTAVFLLWLVLILFMDVSNNHILSKKVAEILPFKGNYILLIIINSFIGGLLAGLSALTASFIRANK